MAGGMDLGTKQGGRKRPLDAQINLVPFIDLMAVTISFLIMTAVWTQAGRIQVSQGGGVPSTEDAPPPITLRLTGSDLRIVSGAIDLEKFELHRSGEKLNLDAFRTAMKALKNENNTRVSISADDVVRYDDLVQVIDACIGAGLADVSVEASS